MGEEPRLNDSLFRPGDDRLANAVALLESLGADPVADPLLAVEPTGATPPTADYVVLTSKTGVEQLADRGWDPGGATLCVIGAATAEAAREAGYTVDRIPEEYSSAGLVDALADEVSGAAVAVARSNHGSAVLTDGLAEAGAEVSESVLYRLTRPSDAGHSTEQAAAGELDAALFSSSLTVEHFLAAARERGVEAAAMEGLADAVVGAIGEPTRETATAHGIDVDVVPETADFETLACAVVEAAAPGYHGA
jgi:uroporphyrinogen-III synthase